MSLAVLAAGSLNTIASALAIRSLRSAARGSTPLGAAVQGRGAVRQWTGFQIAEFYLPTQGPDRQCTSVYSASSLSEDSPTSTT